MIPLILMAAGTAMQVAGQISSNYAMAQAEKQNEKFYEEQAKYAKMSQARAEAISEVDYTTRVGQQTSAYAGGGVDISGSAAMTIAGTLKQSVDDLWAIKLKGDLDAKLARLRQGQSAERATTLSSTSYNAMQAGGTILNNFASTKGYGAYSTPAAAPTAGAA